MSYNLFSKNTSILIGVFFCFCLLLPACEEKKSTPVWQQETLTKPAAEALLYKKEPHQDYPPVRFLSYNLKNYLTMTTYKGGHESLRSKPSEETEAITNIITDAQPDILGICEIGTQEDLTRLQKRLSHQGVHLPHTHITQGADPVRSLAILSRFPITEKPTVENLYYSIDDSRLQMSRGILDVTIQLPERKVRFLGAHLKSKRPSRRADQEIMRRQEANLLRKHADSILTRDPQTQLIVYGDFNDTKRSHTLNTLRGRSRSPLSLSSIEIKDSRGETWTHYWNYEDIYSRFDYVMISPATTRHINKKQSSILDPDHWKKASDHRPLLVIIK